LPHAWARRAPSPRRICGTRHHRRMHVQRPIRKPWLVICLPAERWMAAPLERLGERIGLPLLLVPRPWPGGDLPARPQPPIPRAHRRDAGRRAEAITVLNSGVRPSSSRRHGALQAHEVLEAGRHGAGNGNAGGRRALRSGASSRRFSGAAHGVRALDRGDGPGATVTGTGRRGPYSAPQRRNAPPSGASTGPSPTASPSTKDPRALRPSPARGTPAPVG
jgi:hypothetical protein